MTDLMENIKNLRGITGAGFLDCKKALEENNNDIDGSIDFLRKKGLAKASKKSSREANEGAVGVYQNQNSSVVLKINTETDFAAKNEVFLDFMDMIGGFALSSETDKNSIDIFKDKTFDGFTIEDHFKNIISKIGENIVLSELFFLKNENSLISTYIHNSYRVNIGKIAVILKSNVNFANEEAKILGKNLCMHIAATKPLALNIDQLDKDIVEREKNIQLETIKASGKPDNIVDKILDGKMKKYFSESTLMNQQYILDPDFTIEKIISNFSANNDFNIIEYNLIALGS